MKAHNVDYVTESYLEGLQFMQNEATDVSLKYTIWFLKLKSATQRQNQQSLVLHCKVLKEGSSNFERNPIPKIAYDAQITTPSSYTPPVQRQYP